jgi:hypothetical protein
MMGRKVDLGGVAMSKRIEDVEKELLNACGAIGMIPQCSADFTFGLAMCVAANGKPVHDLTIGELLEIERKHSDAFLKRKYGIPLGPFFGLRDKL